MDADDGVRLLEHAFEKEEDQLLFARWVQHEQYVISFDDFKAALHRKRLPAKPTKAILEDVGSILQAFEQER